MKSLYESILDDEEVIANQSMKLLKDVYDISNITMGNEAWSEVQVARYFKWNDIKNYCRKNGLKPEKRFSLNGVDISELPTIASNVPYIGFEQNILVLLRGFLKSRFTIAISNDKWTSNSPHIIYNITKPSGDPEDNLELIFWLREKKS